VPTNNLPSPSSSIDKARSNYGYIIVAASFIIVMMNVGMYLSIGVFFKPIISDLGWTRAATSAPVSVSSIIAGTMTDRYGPRKVATILGAATGVGYLLMSRMGSLWELYLYFGLLIGSGAGLLTPFLSLIPRWFTNRRTVFAGVISAGGGVGGLVMPLVASWLITTYDWHRAYLIMGIVYLVVVVSAAQLLRRSPPQPLPAAADARVKKPVETAKVTSYSLKQAVGTRHFWLMIILVFSFGYIANTFNLHMAAHATDIGFDPTAAAGLLSIMNGVSIIGCILLGALGDRYGNRRLLIVTFIAEALMMFWLVYIGQYWMLVVFASIYGLAFGSGLAQPSPLVARLFGVGSLGLILGVINFSQTIGASVGGYVAGWLFDIQQNYKMAFYVAAAFGIIGLISTLLLTPLRHKEKAKAVSEKG
jgi:MFS family permease